ncbi:hypothetical protein PPSQR21_032390 [Paenibacillus polymyxa SQR-21]|nr:hypothetical protein [Paenibacillus polymyxa]AHM66878.1 hypothetical protein PPSQR21_032390 [Paenibacillus polymyxa SQR-21]
MKDWVNLITAIIQLATALAIWKTHRRNKKKKGTNKRRGGRRR